MIRKFTFSYITILVFTITFSSAQPILQSVNIPYVGDLWSNKTINDTTIQPGPGGQGQVWNFQSYFVYPTLLSENFVSPTGTSNDLLFPNANMKVISFFGMEDYFNRNSSELQYLGTKSNSLELIFSNVQNVLTIPLAYGDSVVNAAVTGTAFQSYPVDGKISVKADGTGDLLLFTGAFANSIRVVTDINVTIGPGSGVDTYLHIQKYAWYTSLYRAPVFQIVTMDFDGPFGGPRQKHVLVSTLTTDVPNLDGANLNFNINPNPAKNKTTITFNLSHETEVTFKIMDLAGRLFKEEKNNIPAGNHSISLDVSTIPKGIYILSAVYGKSNLQQKLVID